MDRDWLDDPSTSFDEKLERFKMLEPIATRGPRHGGRITGHPLLRDALLHGRSLGRNTWTA